MISIESVLAYAITVWALIRVLEMLLGIYTFNKNIKLHKELNTKGSKINGRH